jgi:uncharacterized protein YciI
VTAPTELDRYTLVLLRRPSDAPDIPEAELDRLQEAHLAHLDSLREHGLLVAGPFLEQVGLEHVAEQVVVAVPGAAVVERDEEEVRAVQHLEHRLAAAPTCG